jgi:hypothetical protein
MPGALQHSLNRISNGWSLAGFGVLAVSLLLAGNLMPGVGLLDSQRHYDADAAYRILAAQGEAGRVWYLCSIWTLDVAIPLSVALSLAIAITLAERRARPPLGRRGQLVRLPIAAGIVDLLENSAISVLLLFYPTRLDPLADVAGIVTSLKHGLYALAVVSAALAWVVALCRRASTR